MWLFCSRLLQNILSINVADLDVIRVGLVIFGIKEKENSVSINSWLAWCLSIPSRLILKSPSQYTILRSFFNFSCISVAISLNF